MDVDFDPAFFEWLGKQPGVAAVVKSEAENVAAKARSTAPVDTGEYRDSIGVEKSDRVVV